MKKIIVVFVCLCLVKLTNAQSWNLSLNTVTGTPNFGTVNSKPINFFTNNEQKMSLSTTGNLLINGLAGTGDRFLQVNSSGQLVPWTGLLMNANKILFGDNTWKTYPFLSDGAVITMQTTGAKLGLGVSTPATELDINGGAQINNGLRVGEAIYVGPSTNYGMIYYTPGTSDTPAMFRFGTGGTANAHNPSPGSSYNPFAGGHGNSSISGDPPPNNSCINGNLASITVNLFQDFLSVQKLHPTIPGSSLGNINLGHDGTNAFIETQGTNPASPNAGDLFINSKCNRNLYVFGNGTSFAPSTDHVMSVAGRLNVTQNMQIGGGTAQTNFLNNSAALYINAISSSFNSALKVFHGAGSADGVQIVEVGASKKALSIYNGTSNTNDGTERFSVQGDGKTQITSANTDALSVYNGTSGPLSFNIGASGFAEIKTANTKAFAVYNTSNSNNETFSIEKSGYTEIKVYSPSGMPTPYSSGKRVFTIRDMTTNGDKDIFVINSNGKVYAREVEISIVQNFPDYVFRTGYKLRSISQVEDYISENKHLPGFEKGEYYEENGINVNTMFIKQQEKIEELMLYIIQLEKRLQEIEKHK